MANWGRAEDRERAKGQTEARVRKEGWEASKQAMVSKGQVWLGAGGGGGKAQKERVQADIHARPVAVS